MKHLKINLKILVYFVMEILINLHYKFEKFYTNMNTEIVGINLMKLLIEFSILIYILNILLNFATWL